MFRKKEKPIKEYTLMEVCEKMLSMGMFTYMPTTITYYEDRIVFVVDRIDGDSSEVVSLTATAPCSEERLIPLELGGESLFWDTKDEVFRIKLLPKDEPQFLIPQVRIYPNEVLAMDQDFAEKWLSPGALSYGTLLEGQYIWCYSDGSAAPVVFELPRLFSAFDKGHLLCGAVLEAVNQLGTYASGYIKEQGLTAENILSRYSENLKKGESVVG